jgi:guanylate kinase
MKDIIEYETDNENFYGTSKAEIEKVQKSGRICIIEMDIRGASSIYKSETSANFIGILPSSLEVLRERLKENSHVNKLNTDAITKLLQICKAEIDEINHSTFFSHRLINDILETSYEEFRNHVTSIFPELKANYEEIQDFSRNKREAIEKELVQGDLVHILHQ